MENKSSENDIDFYNIIKLIQDNKWIILSFTIIIAFLISSITYDKRKIFTSKINVTIGMLPPFYDEEKVMFDFKNYFFSEKIFNNWIKDNKVNDLSFNRFKNTEEFDGIKFSKNEKEQLITISFIAKKTLFKTFYLEIKTNEKNLLNEVFNYCNYINKLIRDQYILRANQELKIIETRFKDFSSANDAIITLLLSVDRYIVASKKGSPVLEIKRPTIPKQLHVNYVSFGFMGAIIGFFLGVLIVVIQNSYRKAKINAIGRV